MLFLKKETFLFASIVTALLLLNPLHGQSVCFDFEENCSFPFSSNEVFEGCFPGWISVHGTPDQTLDEGSNVIRMAIARETIANCETPDRGEGIAYNFSPNSSCSYDISFRSKRSANPSFHRLQLIALPTPFSNVTTSDQFFGCPNDNATPPIPAEATVIYNITENQNSQDWETVNIENAVIPPGTQQIWFRGAISNTPTQQERSFWMIDDFCITERDCPPVCDATPTVKSELVACENEGKTGFVSLTFLGETGLSFDWRVRQGFSWVPVNNGGCITTCDDSSVLFNAPPGRYRVRVTTEAGCNYTYYYHIARSCCDMELKCSAPQWLSCANKEEGVNLSWNTSDAAQGYLVKITVNAPGLCIPGVTPYTVILETTENGITLEPGDFGLPNDELNFRWWVAAVCENGGISNFSEGGFVFRSRCVNGIPPCFELESFPNPTSGKVTLRLVGGTEVNTAKLTVFDLQYRPLIIRELTKSELKLGQTMLDLSEFKAGTYFVQLNLDGKMLSDKIVVSNNN